MIKAYVFDWDGTLFDSISFKKKNIGIVFNQQFNCQPEMVETLFIEYSGIPRKSLFLEIGMHLGIATDLLEGRYDIMSEYFTHLNMERSSSAKLFPEVVSVLEKLSKNHVLYISSSARLDEITASVKRLGIGSFFKDIFGSSEYFYKGQPHFKKIIDEQNYLKEHLIFVGDDKHDGLIARDVGVPFRRICRQKTTLATDEIGSLDELLKLI